MADKLRIVIAQTYQESIDALKDALSGVRRHAISYTQDPREALALAGHSKTVLLVTGQYFYGTDDKTPESSLLKLLTLDAKYRATLERFRDLSFCTNLVHAARTLNSNLITLRYSATPKSPEYLCGDVVKSADCLKALVHNPAFWRALRTKKRSELPSLVGVTWYPRHFPASWRA